MKIPHGVILASAGSGKTYRLSRRILGLLAHGAAPAEIVALTFTRKAAAEFVSRVLTTLALAAQDDSAAEKLARELALPAPAGPAEPPRLFFQKLLAGTVAQSHRLRFGTMDGFFQSLVRTHPLEFGIPGGFALLDERRAARERARLLRALLRTAAEDADARDFLESFRLASFGDDARSAAGLLDRFAREALDLYRESADAARWGEAGAVWPAGCPWLPAPDEPARLRLSGALIEAAERFESGHKGFDKSLRAFAAKAAAYRPGTPIAELGDFATERFLKPGALAVLLRGEPFPLEYARKAITLPPALTHPLGALLHAIIGTELTSRLRRTAGAGRLLARYAAAHEAALLASGRLGFADILHLLARDENAPLLTEIAFRLDGAAAHWLFDEFQDTSRRAWRILGACAAEALACSDGAKSVFLVGDTKQAIYAWNGGDHRLLPELTSRHALPARDLTETQRCGPEVIAMVNAVCRRFADAPGLPESAARDWASAWRDHTCAERARAHTGLARWIIVEKPARDADEDADDARLRVVVDRIRAADFAGRGLAAGILTRTNAEATRAAEALRHAGIPCVCETDTAPVRDNPVTLALLAAVRHAAHPGDTLARETLAMSPLAGRVDGSALLDAIARDGVESALRDLLASLAPVLPADAFSQKRVATLLEIAREYDATGERDAADFEKFAAATLRRETGGAGRVQVMTVHKSKGLEFDAVFLPFLEGDPIDSVDSGDFQPLRESADDPPRAILSMPPAAVCEVDPVLRDTLDARRATAAYEQLCALYVALTRARRELTLISHAPPKNAAADRAPGWTGLLAHAFELPADNPPGEVFAWGEPDWIDSVSAPAPAPATPVEPAPAFPLRAACATVSPSDWKQRPPSAAPTGADREAALAYGTEVHRILQHLETIAPDESEPALRDRLHAATAAAAPDAALHTRALAGVMHALASPDFRRVFMPPPGTSVHRELPFSYLRTDGVLVSGIIDRILVAQDGCNATVLDFKTDLIDPNELPLRYTVTMEIYRTATAALFGIPTSAIGIRLLHVPTGVTALLPSAPIL